MISLICNNAPSSLVLWSIGHCTACFVFKPVRISFLKYRCPTDSWVDVYSYNFRDDRRLLKIMGNGMGLICYFVQLMDTLNHSLFRLSSGDCSNGSNWCRCLLLVHSWIRRPWRAQEVSVFANWHPDNGCIYLAYCPSILLLSYLDVEQTPVVVLHCHRHRQFNAFHPLEVLPLVTFLNSFLLLKQLGRYGAASR